ncbi:hypothetical protein MUU49_20765 [Scandinavium goeteborgense]|uniref:hypothetical protein n=1 Tax=Scandinavium goeteborgense TaxID=1851514 RepID=UPI0021657810|nr:hypothetical protein [Scandinavium goeteborgense]MCS2154985.1 hypothetical protein [Scandinavium goeteborgense]
MIILTVSIFNDEQPFHWINSQLVIRAAFNAEKSASKCNGLDDYTGFVGCYLISGCEFNGVQKRGYAYFQGVEAITGRAGLPQQATSPKLAKSKEIQSK